MRFGNEARGQADDTVTDAELLLRLRTGDQQAYIMLWKRHIDASLRLAKRLAPVRADDLVSEAFLAVYEQVVTTDKGPTSAFRAYLFTVMRNLAIKWAKESSRVDTIAEIEQIDLDDALQAMERDSDAAEMFAAFQQLPERWQRVLWLSEVERLPRPQIAVELGMKPNAVSSLQRRARAGLRLHWLVQQVPPSLRNDQTHLAGQLPSFILGQAASNDALQIEAHVSTCGVCHDLLQELKPLAVRMQKSQVLTAGFAALVVVLPAASPLTTGVAVGSAAVVAGTATGVTLFAGLTAGGIGTLAIGGILVAALFAGFSTATTASEDSQSDTGASSSSASGSSDAEDRFPGGDRSGESPDSDAERGDSILGVEIGFPVDSTAVGTGRHNTDGSIKALDFSREPNHDLREHPPVPTPEDQSTVPDPGSSDENLAPGVVTPPSHSGYLAPVLAGTTSPEAQVAVETLGNRYLATVEDDGSWSFDLRPFDRTVGTHEYVVWAYTETAQSSPVFGTYTLLPVEVVGFEGNPTLHISEALDTGIVMSVSGPSNGTICLDSMAGQAAMIDLDADGEAVRRIRMHSNGFYVFIFRACTGEYRGAHTEAFVTVLDPAVLFEPWGPDPIEMTFDISEV